jgi:DNA-binding NarL/FixJ family response regulator
MSLPRVMIADDHVLMLEGLERLLASHFTVVGTATSGRALVPLALQLEPDAIVLDVSMPDISGIEAAAQLRKLLPNTKLIFLTMHCSIVYLKEALRVGAAAYVLKSSASSELYKAITFALKGQRYITPLMDEEVRNSGIAGQQGDNGGGLTIREREVLRLVAEGRTAKEIATLLRISPRTSEFHKRQLMLKLGVRTSVDLVRIALRDRFVIES